MPFNLNAERERRNTLAKETRNLLDASTGNGNAWTTDDQTKYDNNMSEIERIDAAIDRHQKVMDLTAENAMRDAGVKEHDNGGAGGKNASAEMKLFNSWCRGGEAALSAEERRQISNAMSGNPALNPEQGGYTVPTRVATTILDRMKEHGAMRRVAEIIPTAGGEPINFPTSDGTGEEGELVPENQAATDLDVSFGTKNLGVFKYSSKVVTVPWELLQDSSVDIEAFIAGRLETRLNRITNRHYTVGTGVGQPQGLVTGAAVGKIGAVLASAAVTYDDLVDLEHSVDPAYRANAKWMFHDNVLASLRKVKDGEGRPIFVPGYDQGNPQGAPDRLLNRGLEINQHMPAPAPGAKSIAFGDFKYYKIRDVMAFTLFRFTDSVYTRRGQVGFLAWMRTGGALLDQGDAVKLFQHGAAA
ncbi:phage major capsid protein [Xanthomonas citri]|uniref:phage major capsid protein n=1 Tax=Xanthomonas citri TaxID=346 RepID=UPI0001CED391|nr:phage major capsid protein [Xanthomonas citri]AMV00052.1 capsid protein [Xanthomonas citri pv. aurantifolii]EFF47883.1 phage phi-c31 gp36-like protein [Xanthomonas citri pv. aurantifolii str. ICPB 10535]MCC8492141.1 phage major capsid protein [Xanthomonas citri pv. fuscans]TBX01152.1 capsid protein [Xanthomonas citri pv. aurantifolii]TBX02607.1 capsid protein [Xanthomonas citri pv. aurantifolii]